MRFTKLKLRSLLFIIVLLSWAGNLTTGFAAGKEVSLQTLIDQSAPNETLVIPAGTYEGPITVHKPLQLQVSGAVTLINQSEQPAIWITANDVRIDGLVIIDTSSSLKEAATILVEASNTVLSKLQLHTATEGIQLINANHNTIRDSSIVWDTANQPEVSLSARRNGIDLYDSHDNLMIGNTITAMHDGIYLENSHRNRVEDNKVNQMRYGIHCMYTDGTLIRNNTGSLNITGAMVMAVHDVELSGNVFYKQSENVNSQGILLFDAHSSKFFDNKVVGNRVGLYIEQSSDNQVYQNEIVQNFIGIQFIEANGNELRDNFLSGNVIDAEARASENNTINGNYWEAFRGVDLDGDQRSDLKNAINPFFQTLTKARPAFQLFFQSPSLVFLEGLFQADQQMWLVDESPLMTPPTDSVNITSGSSKIGTAVLGICLILLSLTTLLYLGVKRS